MARLCERPGCSAPAACVYAIDTKRLRVRIEPLASDDTDRLGLGHRAGVLCRRHADSMVVPLGWTLDDKRPSERRATAPTAVQAPPSAPRRATRRRERHEPEPDGVEQLALLSLPEDPPDVRPAAAPSDTRGGPGRSTDTVIASTSSDSIDSSDAVDGARRDGAALDPAEGDSAGAAVDCSGIAAKADVVVSDPAGVGVTPVPDSHDEESATAGTSQGEDAPADPWRPVFDQSDDLGGLLTARSPLLSRAFGRRERRAAVESDD